MCAFTCNRLGKNWLRDARILNAWKVLEIFGTWPTSQLAMTDYGIPTLDKRKWFRFTVTTRLNFEMNYFSASYERALVQIATI